ncbi:hypothetical protein MRX96_046604 [Rhipicephalus microplus]
MDGRAHAHTYTEGEEWSIRLRHDLISGLASKEWLQRPRSGRPVGGKRLNSSRPLYNRGGSDRFTPAAYSSSWLAAPPRYVTEASFVSSEVRERQRCLIKRADALCAAVSVGRADAFAMCAHCEGVRFRECRLLRCDFDVC